MSDETKMGADGVDDVSRMTLAELRLRLEWCESESCAQRSELIKEIVGLGTAALPLMPLLVEKYRADRILLPTSTWGFELYQKTRFEPLLHAFLEKNALAACFIWQKCWLFENGLSDLEQEILEYLSKFKSAEPGCLEAVKSLGNSGGSKALEMLEVTRYKLSAELPEKKAKAMLRQSEEDDFKKHVEYLEYGAHEEFLEEVKKAIGRIKERMKACE